LAGAAAAGEESLVLRENAGAMQEEEILE